MHTDTVVIAGIATVVLLLAFFVGFGYFIYWDSQRARAKAAPDPLPEALTHKQNRDK